MSDHPQVNHFITALQAAEEWPTDDDGASAWLGHSDIDEEYHQDHTTASEAADAWLAYSEADANANSEPDANANANAKQEADASIESGHGAQDITAIDTANAWPSDDEDHYSAGRRPSAASSGTTQLLTVQHSQITLVPRIYGANDFTYVDETWLPDHDDPEALDSDVAEYF
ncbi:hypothetical protein BYT27DRAFT_7213877 [Phlegmacium glaucopus]|nr:hypothetical protein BYT27DRAFT_7213877 [Phlegmacium glaucopus]